MANPLTAASDLEHDRVFGKLVGVIDPADFATTVQRQAHDASSLV